MSALVESSPNSEVFSEVLDQHIRQVLNRARQARGGLPQNLEGIVELYVADTVSSTMDWARGDCFSSQGPGEIEAGEQDPSSAGGRPPLIFSQAYEVGARSAPLVQIFLARHQSAGRGRENRRWISERDAGVWLTARITFPVGTQLNGLSLAVGTGILNAVKNLTPPSDQLVLKWPNDVGVLQRRDGRIEFSKLAGVLCETHQSEMGIVGGPTVLVGVGLNIFTFPELISAHGLGLDAISDSSQLYFRAVGEVCAEVLAVIARFQMHGWSDFLGEVRRHSMGLNGLMVRGTIRGDSVTGYVRGIADDGALLIEPRPGERQRCYAGEVTIQLG